MGLLDLAPLEPGSPGPALSAAAPPDRRPGGSKVSAVSHQPFARGAAERAAGRSAASCARRTSPTNPSRCGGSGACSSPTGCAWALLLALIVLGSVLSVASPFLLREAVDKGIVNHDLDAADAGWSAGMIALAIINGVISVAQTWISNQVGQRVMHDLRAAVYAHLQRMSLAFFTRTRSGEVQARIAYDIGGIDDVVTSTATSTVSTVATVHGDGRRDVRAQLAADALLADPAAVLRVADAARGQRAQAHPVGAPEPPGGHVDARGGVPVGVGDPAGQDDGPLAASSSTASPRSPANWPTSRSARGWRGAGGWPSVQMSFAIMPAAVYWFAGYSIVQRPRRRSRSARSSRSRRCRRGCCSRCSSCCRWALKCRPRWRCSGASSSTSTSRSTSSSAPAPRELTGVRGDVALQDVWFRYAPEAPWTLQEIDAEIPAGTRTALVGETGLGQDDARLSRRAPVRAPAGLR